jgi:hypothetical protein
MHPVKIEMDNMVLTELAWDGDLHGDGKSRSWSYSNLIA